MKDYSNQRIARLWTHQSLWVLHNKTANNNYAHRSNKNSKTNDDNPETVEILKNPITKYDAHKAEGNM